MAVSDLAIVLVPIDLGPFNAYFVSVVDDRDEIDLRRTQERKWRETLKGEGGLEKITPPISSPGFQKIPRG